MESSTCNCQHHLSLNALSLKEYWSSQTSYTFESSHDLCYLSSKFSAVLALFLFQDQFINYQSNLYFGHFEEEIAWFSLISWLHTYHWSDQRCSADLDWSEWGIVIELWHHLSLLFQKLAN